MEGTTGVKDKKRTWTKLDIEAKVDLTGDDSISLPEESREDFIKGMKEPFITVFQQAYEALIEKAKEGKLPELIEITITIKPRTDDDPTFH